VVDLVNSIDPRFAQKYLFTFEKDMSQLGRVEQAHVQVHNVPRRSKFDLSMCTYIAHLIDSEQIDLIHCTMQFSLLMGWVARRRAKRKPPLVCAIHITRNKDMKTELQDRLLYHWLLLACDKLIFVCETQRMHCISKFSGLADKAEVVHNGVDLDYFNAQAFNIERTSFRKRHRIADDAVVFCCIAGFRSEKGHLILLQSFAKVLAAFPNACMVLAGDGPTRQAAHDYADRHGIAKHVVFTGNVSDVRPILAASDIKVLASTSVETFSVAMLEAMAMGLPVISTAIGGAAEAVIDGQTGLLVPIADSDALAAAMTRAISDRRTMQIWGESARRMVATRFNKTGMVGKTVEVLSQAMHA
jgi:glycosyltransferase involved in cell wall biosynthesis